MLQHAIMTGCGDITSEVDTLNVGMTPTPVT